MRYLSIIKGVGASIPLFIGLVVPADSRAATIVNAGWDVFETLPGTAFMGVPFQGVNLGTHNFGPGLGLLNVGTADTIVRRTAAVNAPSGSTPLLMEALQL